MGGNLSHFRCLAGWVVELITSVRLIQVGNNRNDHFRYFLGVRLIKVSFKVHKGNKFGDFGYCLLNRGCPLNTVFHCMANIGTRNSYLKTLDGLLIPANRSKHSPDVLIFHSYRIYSINRPGHLLNFWTLRVGAYSRWALIRGWALIKFSVFSASVVCLFCNKTINGTDKTRRCNKARFL